MMDQETAHYVLKYFPRLLTPDERMAIKHTMSLQKLNYSNNTNSSLTKVYKKNGWLSTDQNVLDLLKDGYEQFELKAANRIMTQYPEKVFLNNCPQCNKLARTPLAKQCRFCGFDWHHIVAQFKLNEVFQLIDRPFFLVGEIIIGKINQGDFLDLHNLGLNKKVKIESIEFVLKHYEDEAKEQIALGINELSKDEQLYLKNLQPVDSSINILITKENN